MAIYDKIGDEKLQYNITREAAKQHYHQVKLINMTFTGEEMFPFILSQMIEQTKFTHPPLEKAFKKQIKTIEDRGRNKLKLQKF